MLYQEGAHNGSNMGYRMHSYPMYQEFQKRAEPLGLRCCAAACCRIREYRNQTERAKPRWCLATISRCWGVTRRSAACSTP